MLMGSAFLSEYCIPHLDPTWSAPKREHIFFSSRKFSIFMKHECWSNTTSTITSMWMTENWVSALSFLISSPYSIIWWPLSPRHAAVISTQLVLKTSTTAGFHHPTPTFRAIKLSLYLSPLSSLLFNCQCACYNANPYFTFIQPQISPRASWVFLCLVPYMFFLFLNMFLKSEVVGYLRLYFMLDI